MKGVVVGLLTSGNTYVLFTDDKQWQAVLATTLIIVLVTFFGAWVWNKFVQPPPRNGVSFKGAFGDGKPAKKR